MNIAKNYSHTPLFFSLLFCLLLLFLYASNGYSETPNFEAATRQTNIDILEKVREKITPVDTSKKKVEEEKTIEQVDEAKFLVSDIVLEGVDKFNAEDFEAIISKYEGREVSVYELNILTDQIEREYLRKGYISAVIVPPQDLLDGKLVIKVIEAKMGNLIYEDKPFFDSERANFYWTIKSGEIIEHNQMLRSLYLLSKNPDRDVGGVLHQGEDFKTSDVLMNIQTQFPLHGTFTYDNEGVVSTGIDRFSFGFRHNNFLNVDDTMLASYMYGKDFGGYYFYHSVPITNFGTSIMYGYSDSKSFPKKEFTPFHIRSYSQNTNFYVNQDLFDGGTHIGNLQVGIEAKDRTTVSTSGTSTRDRLRNLVFSSTFTNRFENHITSFSPSFNQGLNILGAEAKSELTSRGAENTHTIVGGSLHHITYLPKNFRANLKVSGQLTSNKVSSQEQFSLGGMNSIRGYPSGDFLADHAIQTNLELMIPIFFMPENIKLPYDNNDLKDRITGIAFFDYGYGEKRSPDITEADDVSFASVGAGVHVRLYNQVLMRFEWGFQLGDSSTSEVANSRCHVSINVEDSIPKEIERIKKQITQDNIDKVTERIIEEEFKDTNSPLYMKAYEYFEQAQDAMRRKDYINAEKNLLMIKRLHFTVSQQVKGYINQVNELRKKIRDQNNEAMDLFKNGDLEKSSKMWQEIKSEAELQPLAIEI